MAPRGNFPPHKLPQATIGVSISAVLCQAQQRDNGTNEVGQCHSGDIHQLGGTHSQPLCQLALSVWDWCIQRNVFLVAEHLPGKDNITADRESRSTKDRCNWMLNSQVFQQLQLLMGPLQTDLFDCRLTKQLPNFYSWRPDPVQWMCSTEIGLKRGDLPTLYGA